MDIIKYKYFFVGFSVALAVLAVVSLLVFGFRPGIDFVGGAFWQIKFADPVLLSDLAGIFQKEGLDNTSLRQAADRQFSIRMKEIGENEHRALLDVLHREFGEVEELSFASIGPAIGQELRNRALLAFLLVLAGISLYVAFAFRKVSQPVSSWKYGLVTLITLFHDVLIPAGIFALLGYLGYLKGVELDTNFIVAVLVIMGFSVHDTIVVFDRIRENLLISKNKKDLNSVINASVNQTFARSMNTSLTLVFVLLALYLLGADSLRHFNFLILLGAVIGTYSSIFVASPLLTFFKRAQ